MKKILSAALVLILMLCCAAPCLATGYKPDDEIKISVNATYRCSSESNEYDSDLENGKYDVTTSGGITVTVTPENTLPDGARLVVHIIPETDNDAYEWFYDCTKNVGENIIPFDIYFIDADGNKISVTEEMTIEITLPDDYGTPVVCSLSTDGKTTVLDSKKDGNKVIFITNHSNYYVIAAKAGGSPQTGDNSNMILWVALLFVSGGALVTLGIEKKRRIANSK